MSALCYIVSWHEGHRNPVHALKQILQCGDTRAAKDAFCAGLFQSSSQAAGDEEWQPKRAAQCWINERQETINNMRTAEDVQKWSPR